MVKARIEYFVFAILAIMSIISNVYGRAEYYSLFYYGVFMALSILTIIVIFVDNIKRSKITYAGLTLLSLGILSAVIATMILGLL
jgi:hypothetical protein